MTLGSKRLLLPLSVVQPMRIKTKPIKAYTSDFSCTVSKMQVITKNLIGSSVCSRCDWSELNYIGVGFFDSNLKLPYCI